MVDSIRYTITEVSKFLCSLPGNKEYKNKVFLQAMVSSSYKLCGTILNKYTFLVVVDAFSKWLQAIEMSTNTTATVIESLQHEFVVRTLFARIT